MLVVLESVEAGRRERDLCRTSMYFFRPLLHTLKTPPALYTQPLAPRESSQARAAEVLHEEQQQKGASRAGATRSEGSVRRRPRGRMRSCDQLSFELVRRLLACAGRHERDERLELRHGRTASSRSRSLLPLLLLLAELSEAAHGRDARSMCYRGARKVGSGKERQA